MSKAPSPAREFSVCSLSADIRPLRSCLISLSEEENACVAEMRISVGDGDVWAEFKDIGTILTGKELRLLLVPDGWLNDNIMNCFVYMMNERNASIQSLKQLDAVPGRVCGNSTSLKTGINEKSFAGSVPGRVGGLGESASDKPSVFTTNTYLYSVLMDRKQGFAYTKVDRWLRKKGVCIADYDLVLLPILLYGDHWVLAVADFRSRSFVYLDSMHDKKASSQVGSGMANDVLDNITRWLHCEVERSTTKVTADALDVFNWTRVFNPPYMPVQKDDGSCGVFALQVADYLAQGRVPVFTQADISVIRARMILTLRDGKF